MHNVWCLHVIISTIQQSTSYAQSTDPRVTNPYSMGRAPYKLAQTNTQVLSKHTVSVTFHWLPFVSYSIDNKLKVKFTNSSNHTEHNKKVTVINCVHKTQMNFTPMYL